MWLFKGRTVSPEALRWRWERTSDVSESGRRLLAGAETAKERGEVQGWEGWWADLTGCGRPPKAWWPLLWDRWEPLQGLKQRSDMPGLSSLKDTLTAGQD